MQYKLTSQKLQSGVYTIQPQDDSVRCFIIGRVTAPPGYMSYEHLKASLMERFRHIPIVLFGPDGNPLDLFQHQALDKISSYAGLMTVTFENGEIRLTTMF